MTDDTLRAALDDPRFRRAVDEVFAAPGVEFGPAKGYYGGDTGHFIDMLWAALAASAPDEGRVNLETCQEYLLARGFAIVATDD